MTDKTMSLEEAKAILVRLRPDMGAYSEQAKAITVILAALQPPQPAPEPDEAPLGQDAPIGTLVFVKLDSGADWVTETRSEPWQLGGGQWVVALKGKAGGYALDRVRRVPR